MDAPSTPLSSLNPGRAGQNTGRPCAVCTAPLKVRGAIEERIARGDVVKSIWRWAQREFPREFALTKYDTFARHNRLHVGLVKRAAKKLSDADRMQRQKIRLARDVLADKVDPQSYFGPAQLAKDIAKTSDRLDQAADVAFEDGEHASLASLSGQLLRSHELRAKLGGSIAEGTQVNLNVTLGELHARLDGILGADPAQRQTAARALLGLGASSNLAAQADPPGSSRLHSDPTNPLGEPLTIDAEASPSRPPLTRPMARRVDGLHDPEPSPASPDDSEAPR